MERQVGAYVGEGEALVDGGVRDRNLHYEPISNNGGGGARGGRIEIYEVRIVGSNQDEGWGGKVGYRAISKDYGGWREVVVNGPSLSKARDKLARAQKLESGYHKSRGNPSLLNSKRHLHARKKPRRKTSGGGYRPTYRY